MSPEIPWAAEGERRNLTVVFIDMVDSTALASQLDPEDLREVMNAFMDVCRDAVEEFGGHVAQYLGDGLVAYFGYPSASEDAGERAVRAALRAVVAISGQKLRPDLSLQARAGVATGLVVIGAPFDRGNRESIASGQTPALAARLQALAPSAGVVIAANTRELLHGTFLLDDLGRQTLKGIAEPTIAWRVLGEAPAPTRFTAAHDGPLARIVDRTAELAQLLDCWHSAPSDGGQLVLLSGEPGIGKSRLLEALRERLADQPHSFVCLQCSPHHRNSAFHPAIRWLEHLTGIVTDDPPAAKLAKLDVLLAEQACGQEARLILADVLSIAHDEQHSSDEKPHLLREQMLAILCRLLTEVTSGQPRLFVLEDAHWADPTTMELMDRVFQAARSVPMLVVISSRSDFDPHWQDQSGVTDLVLGRLPRPFCAQLAENVAAGKDLPLNIRDEILDRADGVALFIEELTKAVLEAETLKLTKQGGFASQEQYVKVPPTLQDSLMARLDRLGPVKAVAQAGAALGREFPYRLLAACVPLEECDLRDALKRLVDAELFFSREGPQEELYTFKHALVRDTAYGSLLRSRRRELHRRIAEVIETSFPSLAESQPELFARHLTEAGMSDAAVTWWSRAGLRELRRSANAEASSHLRRALELLRALPTGQDRDRRELELRMQINAPLQVTKGFASAEFEENATRAQALSASLGEASTLPVLWSGCVTALVRSDLDQAFGKISLFLRLAETRGDIDAILTGHRGLGHAHLASGDLSIAALNLERALKLYDPSRRDVYIANYANDPMPIILGQYAMVLQQLGRWSEATTLVAQARRETRQAGHYGSQGYAAFYVALFYMIEGNVEAVEEIATEFLESSQQHGGAYWALQFDLLLGWRQAMAGAIDAGLQRMRRAEAERQQIQARLWTPLYFAEEAKLLIASGRVDKALCRLKSGLLVVKATGQCFAEAELLRVRALALAAKGARMEEMAVCLDWALKAARSRGARLWEERTIATRVRLLGFR
jgi:class 3 adenylate cyclase/tetratricopeptide (TPR) repeat protein